MDQNLSCSHTAAEKQMAQISCMLHLFIIGNVSFQEVFMHTSQDFRHIFMNQLTVICCKNIIGTAFFVQTQRQRTILICITKGEFHFISISEFNGTSMNSLPLVISAVQCTIQQFTNLTFFHFELVFIGHGLIHASSTFRKNATDRFSCFKRRLLQHFQKSSLCTSGTLLIDHKTNFLSGHSVLYGNFLSVCYHNSLIGKIYFLNHAFINFAFFHITSIKIAPV